MTIVRPWRSPRGASGKARASSQRLFRLSKRQFEATRVSKVSPFIAEHHHRILMKAMISIKELTSALHNNNLCSTSTLELRLSPRAMSGRKTLAPRTINFAFLTSMSVKPSKEALDSKKITKSRTLAKRL